MTDNNKQVMKAILRYLENHGLTLDLQMDFPQYRIKPPEVELAIAVLAKHGMVYKLSVKETPKPTK